jgi:three-Cys-motif partner protein
LALIVNPEGLNCESVKWHTRQKHAFLEAYFEIWSSHVGKDNNSIPTLDIFDLYASCGLCYCKEQNVTWKGSALAAACCLKDYSKGRTLFLNSYDLEDKDSRQVSSLSCNLQNMYLPSRVNVILENLPVEAAVDVAISHINRDFPSFWIFDPYEPASLPWKVVEKVCRLEGNCKNGKVRRPELFINLITSTLERYTGKDDLKEDYVGITLGINKDEWKDKLSNLLAAGYNTRKALIIMYAEKLMEFYKKPPLVLDVPAVHGNIVYTVFLCTDSDAGYYMMKLHKLPMYQQWQKVEWKKTAQAISKKKKVSSKAAKSGQKQAYLDDYSFK